MAGSKAFADSNGSAKKSNIEYVKMGFGTNKVRFVGNLLPRYVYWKKLKEMNIPVECLSFDRDKEKFTNVEKDWFKHYFPKKENGDDMTCSWSYAIQAIDLSDGKLKVCGLKSKLFAQIMDLASELGDPTDPVTGWDIVFDKKKTGPLAYNVEYKLMERKIEPRPLTDDELDVIKDMKDISELMPRQTSEEQHAFIKSAWLEGEDEETNADKKATEIFDDDIPF